eukprot:scaffold42050_cov21-Tisochrysis_lutea.AAC.1
MHDWCKLFIHGCAQVRYHRSDGQIEGFDTFALMPAMLQGKPWWETNPATATTFHPDDSEFAHLPLGKL